MRLFFTTFLLFIPLVSFAATPVAEWDAGKLYKFDDVPVVVENRYDQRRANLQTLARHHKGRIDVATMKTILDQKSATVVPRFP